MFLTMVGEHSQHPQIVFQKPRSENITPNVKKGLFAQTLWLSLYLYLGLTATSVGFPCRVGLITLHDSAHVWYLLQRPGFRRYRLHCSSKIGTQLLPRCGQLLHGTYLNCPFHLLARSPHQSCHLSQWVSCVGIREVGFPSPSIAGWSCWPAPPPPHRRCRLLPL